MVDVGVSVKCACRSLEDRQQAFLTIDLSPTEGTATAERAAYNVVDGDSVFQFGLQIGCSMLRYYPIYVLGRRLVPYFLGGPCILS